MFKENISTKEALAIGKSLKTMEESVKSLYNSANVLYSALEALGASKDMMDATDEFSEHCSEELKILKAIVELLKK